MNNNINLNKIKEKSLKKGFSKSGGRNNKGRITHFHRGNGHKRLYRIIDFKNNIEEGIIQAISYDPNRTAFIALVKSQDENKYYYMIAPEDLKEGDLINIKDKVSIGSTIKLKDLAIGTYIHNVELKPEQGGKLIKAAGAYGQIIQKQQKYVKIRLPSNEQRLIFNECYATIGKVSNALKKK